jgi:hypothetical protein
MPCTAAAPLSASSKTLATSPFHLQFAENNRSDGRDDAAIAAKKMQFQQQQPEPRQADSARTNYCVADDKK